MDRIINVKVGGNYISKDNRVAGVKGEANVTCLRITFDEGWSEYAKKITFWNAKGLNPRVIFLDGYLESSRVNNIYIVPIPAEPLAEAGMLTFVIEGIIDGKIQRSVADRLEVKDSPIADDVLKPDEVTPDEVEQMQLQLKEISDNIAEAMEAKEEIENMSVSAETLATGEDAFVNKTVKNDTVNLHFGLPAGDKGDTGDSGVYIGNEAPTDPNKNVWIDTSGEATGIKGLGSLMTSVKTFGAKGDGVTDDTIALKAAASCGEAVFFPAGTYLLYEQIDMSADINWFGEGEKSVIKLMPADKSRPEEYDGKTVYNCYMINHIKPSENDDKCFSISLQGLVLDANKDEFIYGEDAASCGFSRYDHVTCLDLKNPKSVYLNNVEIRNGLIEGCYIYSGDTHISISNCKFHDNGEKPHYEDNGDYIQGDGSGLHIQGDGTNAIITNCEFNDNGFHGLLLGGTNAVNVSNISCSNNGKGGAVLWGGASRNILNGLYCRGNKYGMMIKAKSSAYIEDVDSNNFAEGNTITGLVTRSNEYGIVFGKCDNTLILGWNSSGDNYSYYLGYGDISTPIYGTVIAALLYETDEVAFGDGVDEANYTDKFKVQFLGR